ncbi:type 1 glutamine amidotransferase [Bradyrhizobium sp. HKCCYLRH3061]|uniref:type 1 glutamine amidotransferase n=1 Tax=Bradyrhizobium sp. HKCCYLRH3061 TaxID=3420734 RepID=UPI003EBC8F58
MSRFAMKTLCVLQHFEADYLGSMEDQFEGRNVGFRYCRPFTAGGSIPATAGDFDGLIVLGAGPLGVVSGNLLPSLGPELRLVRDFLARGLPVIGIGAGSCILATACGGGTQEAPLRFVVETARRVDPAALGGHLPRSFPVAIYMRDRPVLPADASVLAIDSAGEPAVFQLRDNCFGFLGHPGIKSAMIEDLIMAFDECPDRTAETLADLRVVQREIAAALGPLMIGLIESTHLMRPLP